MGVPVDIIVIPIASLEFQLQKKDKIESLRIIKQNSWRFYMHEDFLRRADILLLSDWSKVTHAHVHGSTMLKTHNFSIISTPTMAESM